MPGARLDVEEARAALERARTRLAPRLEADRAWRAWRQLTEREARGEGLAAVDGVALRARLEAELDARHADWRLLPRIEAALSALGPLPEPAAARAAAAPTPATPPPQSTAVTAAPTPAVPPSADSGRATTPPPLPAFTPPLQSAPTRQVTPPPVSAVPPAPPPAPVVSEGVARVRALESEIERRTRGGQPAGAAVAAATPKVASREPAFDADLPLGAAEEAEVEIVQLPAVPERKAESTGRLAERLQRATGAPPDPVAPARIPEVVAEEATVEIVAVEPAPRPPRSAGG